MKEREDVRDGEGSGSQKVREEPGNSWLNQGGPGEVTGQRTGQRIQAMRKDREGKESDENSRAHQRTVWRTPEKQDAEIQKRK